MILNVLMNDEIKSAVFSSTIFQWDVSDCSLSDCFNFVYLSHCCW